MTLKYHTVSFMSDYGRTDEFVGVCHSVMRGLAPGLQVIDLTHDIPAFDVRAGGLALARCVQYLSPGLVLAVVDPGVGTDRRAVAVEVGGGTSILLGPDNGVLAPAVAFVGGATDAVVLDNPEHQLPAAGATFDGRDVFAPGAAALANGVPLHEVGTPIDTATLVPGTMPVAREEKGALVAEVLWVDHFGNVQLNIDADDIAEFGPHLELKAMGKSTTAKLVGTFDDAGAGSVALIVDSYGLIAVVAQRASAAEVMSVAAGDEVTVRSAGAISGGPEVSVMLGQKPAAGVSGSSKRPADSETEGAG